MRFSAPVFFDDGKNMFLAEGKTVKPYHIQALKRWHIPFLLSFGHKIDATAAKKMNEAEDLDELEELDDVNDLEPVD